MQVVDVDSVSDKIVLLRYDIDVALRPVKDAPKRAQGILEVAEDFRLKKGLPTLNLCLQHARKVILIGHIGRPEGQVVAELSIAPILKWFEANGFLSHLSSGKLKVLENLRFDSRESFDPPRRAQDREKSKEFAKELAQMGDVFVNEAFAAYRPAASTTILPTLLPHYAGLNFAKEVEILKKVKENPEKPLIAIMGGAKVKDKLPVIKVLAERADAVLVGGKLVQEIKEENLELPANVMVAKLKEDGLDIAQETTNSWKELIATAKMIIWNGPVGKFEDRANNQTAYLAQAISESAAETILGGGDTITAINMYGLSPEKFSFVSTGGGAMLKLLSDGTLPTIDVLS